MVRELAERAVAGGRLLEELGAESHGFLIIPSALLRSDALEPARYWLEQAMADARARGSATGFAATSSARAELSYRMGELAEAEAAARRLPAPAATDRRWRRAT